MLPGFQSILVNAANEPKGNQGDHRRPTYKSPQVLVLAPTRELSNQIATEAYKYHSSGVSTVSLYGGAPKGGQIASLRQGADCVVATPGRCNDLMDEGVFDTRKIKYLVLDEADRMCVHSIYNPLFCSALFLCPGLIVFFSFYELLNTRLSTSVYILFTV